MDKLTEDDIKKLPLEKLKELLERQENLLKRCNMLSKLSDKGESVRKLHQLLRTEIENRKLVEIFSNLRIASDDESLDKHSQFVCGKETNKTEGKFKPFDTLKNGAAHSRHGKIHDSEISAAVEPNWSNTPSTSIPLKESLKLQEEYINKLKKEQAKRLVKDQEVIEGTTEAAEEEDTEQSSTRHPELEQIPSAIAVGNI